MTAAPGAGLNDGPRADREDATMGAAQGARQHPRRMLPGPLFVLLAFPLLLLSIPAARAGGPAGTIQLLAALNGAEALSASAMAKASAGGVGAGEAAGVHLPLPAPKVRLWDDFGARPAPAIGETTVTVSGGGRQP